MSSPLVVALLFAIGSSGWVYVQLSRRTGGGNQRAAAIGTAITGIIVFIFFYTLFTMFIKLD